MKYLIVIVCLLVSFSANAITASEWNMQFGLLNNVPHNAKAHQEYLQSYYRRLIADKPAHYKNPDDYSKLIVPTPSAPTVVRDDTAKELINNIRINLDLLEKLK
jgi:hypothetical protein